MPGENGLLKPGETVDKPIDAEQQAIDAITSADKSKVDNVVSKKLPPNAEVNREACVAMITDYLDANAKELTTGEESMVYMDLFKSVIESGATSKSINNINAILLDTKLDKEIKNQVLKGIIQNIKEKTEEDEDFAAKIVDRKVRPDEWKVWSKEFLEKMEIEGMTVGAKKMTYTVGLDGKTLLGSGWFDAKDVRNGAINDGYGGYNPNFFKDNRVNQSLADKEGGGYDRDRYFIINEKEETKPVYQNTEIKKAIIENDENIPADAKITVNINKALRPSLDVQDKNQETIAIQDLIYANTTNKISTKNISVNFVDASKLSKDANVGIDVAVPAKEEILGPIEDVLLTTQFEKTKSDINEGERKIQLINTFKKYLIQDESGQRKLNTEKYKLFKINSIEGNASSIFDPNAPIEEAKMKNEEYAKNRLNTAIAFLNDIGTPKTMIDNAPQISQVHYERQDEADQNIKINRQIQEIIQPKTEGYTKTIDVTMPTTKTVTWDVIHTRLSSASKAKDDPMESLLGKIFG